MAARLQNTRYNKQSVLGSLSQALIEQKSKYSKNFQKKVTYGKRSLMYENKRKINK